MDLSVRTPTATRPGSSVPGSSSEGSGGEGEHRIRVVNGDGECLGYLGWATSLLPDYWEGCLDAACDEANAFRVIVKPGTGDTKLSRIFVLGPGKWLGIKWEKCFCSRAAVALFEETKEGSLTSRLHPHRWVGQARTAVWEIGSGRKIIPNGTKKTAHATHLGLLPMNPLAWPAVSLSFMSL
ncbi:hypothetical protein M407DRAFT_110954 [Tulasnella calospora MUT 4182]|uniref:Uncharacterized protein n=1 Tax=Tulasnella calospora MUT 4182 TaxID=1051891 RepID=A0A0C3KPA7_9AGAM|nr:hypothetical protein M407DRAFT_110954 [Tulasnella calospora MUT 4182]